MRGKVAVGEELERLRGDRRAFLRASSTERQEASRSPFPTARRSLDFPGLCHLRASTAARGGQVGGPALRRAHDRSAERGIAAGHRGQRRGARGAVREACAVRQHARASLPHCIRTRADFSDSVRSDGPWFPGLTRPCRHGPRARRSSRWPCGSSGWPCRRPQANRVRCPASRASRCSSRRPGITHDPPPDSPSRATLSARTPG